jgi:hypothetical protein
MPAQQTSESWPYPSRPKSKRLPLGCTSQCASSAPASAREERLPRAKPGPDQKRGIEKGRFRHQQHGLFGEKQSASRAVPWKEADEASRASSDPLGRTTERRIAKTGICARDDADSGALALDHHVAATGARVRRRSERSGCRSRVHSHASESVPACSYPPSLERVCYAASWNSSVERERVVCSTIQNKGESTETTLLILSWSVPPILVHAAFTQGQDSTSVPTVDATNRLFSFP